MSKQKKLFDLYGDPADLRRQAPNMTTWNTPPEILKAFKHVRFTDAGTTGFPRRIFMHRLLEIPLTNSLQTVIERKLTHELKTWDGCYLFRPIRGYERRYYALITQGRIVESLKYLSLHAFGAAFDINKSENPLGVPPKMPKNFVDCFTFNGLDWGGNFARLDGMHFEIKL